MSRHALHAADPRTVIMVPAQGYRAAGFALVAGALAIGGGCGAGPRPALVTTTTSAEFGSSSDDGSASGEAADEALPERVDLERPQALSDLDPSILRPRVPADDQVVARVGEVAIHQSHVFQRLLEGNRRAALDLVDVLVMDAVIAAQAERHSVTVDFGEIDALVQSEEEVLRERVRIEWGMRKSFDQYVAEQFDLDVADYRRFLRIELARERYRSQVIRFLSLLEDRVEVRVLVNRNRDIVADSAERVRNGADFATLAFRHSEDETRSDGGRMPPFGRAFEHPIARVAFELDEGGLSEVFEMDVDGTPHHALVYCLRRVPGRPGVEFEEVRGEIKDGLDERALSPFELQSFALRWCGDAAERLPSEATGR